MLPTFSKMAKPNKENQEDVITQKMNDVVQGFLFKMRIKIICDKYAFLLSKLLEDIAVMSEEHGLPDPVITNTRTLKRKILEEFPEEMSFFS